MYTFLSILLVAGVVLLILLLRYGLNRLADKAGDTIVNAVKAKKNKQQEQKSHSLADEYKTPKGGRS